MSSLQEWMGQRIGLGGRFGRFWASFVSGNTWAGEPVTPKNVMTIGAVWRAVFLNAGTIGALPLVVYKRLPNGESVVADDDDYNIVLRVSPNDDQTALEFLEAWIACEVLVGNGYARIDKTAEGRITALYLLSPEVTTPFRDRDSGKLRYRHIDWRGREIIYPPDEILHLKGFSFGGDLGLSAVQFGANTFSSTMAADKVAGKMFRSGLSSSGFIETQTTFTEGDRKRVQKILEEYSGSENAGKMMILEGGMTYKPVSMSAADAQLLLSRGFNIEEVGRWYGTPTVLLGHSSPGQTMWGTGVESIIRAWYTLGLNQRITRVEKAIGKRLIKPKDRLTHYVKFNVDALLRGDSTSQAALFSSAVQNGWMSRAEVRKLLELPTIPGADMLTAQVNLVPLAMLGENGGADAAQLKAQFRAWLGLEGPGNAPPAQFQLPAPLPPEG